MERDELYLSALRLIYLMVHFTFLLLLYVAVAISFNPRAHAGRDLDELQLC
jgi:hypothetical protein